MSIPQRLVSGRAVQRKIHCSDFNRSLLRILVVFHQTVGFNLNRYPRFAVVKRQLTMIGVCPSGRLQHRKTSLAIFR
jgi:hypothetical protein